MTSEKHDHNQDRESPSEKEATTAPEHEHSHAAHLKDSETKPHTKPMEPIRKGSGPNSRRQP